MTAKKKQSRAKTFDADFDAVASLVKDNRITANEIIGYSEIDYPIFSFRYLAPHSFPKCKDASFFQDFLARLQKLSELGWKRIALSDRHSFGTEKIGVCQIKPRRQLPPFVTDDMKLEVFRANGNNLPFVGLRNGRTFHIFFIETSFGDVYYHD